MQSIGAGVEFRRARAGDRGGDMDDVIERNRRFGKRLGLLAVVLAAGFALGATPAQAAPVPGSTTAAAAPECAGPCPILLFRKGNGSGRVTSTPAGIDCGTACDATLDDVDGIVMTATPGTGSRIDQWQGCPDTVTRQPNCYIPPGGGSLGLTICVTFVVTSAPNPGSATCPPDQPPPPPPPPPPPANAPPNTRITSGPPVSTRSRRATFRFRANENRVTYLCKLDGRSWFPCRSPKSYARLRRGPHTFRVRAIDAGGKLDPTPAVRRWRIRA
jgi:hypothetical protein